MKQISIVKAVLKLMLVSVVGLLVACDNDSVGTTAGYVVAAPVSGANVLVKDTSGNVMAVSVTTASDGSYSTDPGIARFGTIILESSGGTYTDEATGEVTTASVLTAYVDGANLAAGSQVHLTPASTIVHDMVVNHGMALSDAQKKFKDTFGFDADSAVAPTDATNPAADATNDELLAGLRAAAFSQLTKDLGLEPSEQFDLLKALAEDLAFGDLDGEGDAGVAIAITANVMLPVDIHNRFSQALIDFHVSDNNLTALTNDQIGVIPFAKVALTNMYKIEYVPGMMHAMEGKTRFTLRISDTSGPVTGLMPKLMPMMHMAAHMHSTPDLDCIAGATDGDYDCTVYYLMPSAMADGTSMGYWELMVMAGMDESATFYPTVMMAMGDTPKVVLKGLFDVDPAIGDTIAGMLGDMSRNYFLFNESLTGMNDDRTFTMFIAAMESMKSYPAVSAGTTLNSGTDYVLIVNTMTVEVSTDAVIWVPATDNGNGNWSATGLTGLVDGTEGEIHVRLSINGEPKTTDGLATSGANEYTTYTVTPGGM